uniref:Uncharacterized protein n=1 Tax=Anguilla anguilla TaxID=7936 RepID=A0A0E9T2S9_ANGAN
MCLGRGRRGGGGLNLDFSHFLPQVGASLLIGFLN